MQAIFNKLYGDRVIWAVVLILSIISILAVYSSIVTLAYKYREGNTEYFLFKHGIILLVGFGLMYLTHNIPFKYYSRAAQVAMIAAIPLLMLTLISGANINEASRWLVIPIINQSFQTSDLAKLALIMYVARVLSKKQENIKDFRQSFIPVILPIFLICGLILPANFSTAAILFTCSMILLFIGRIKLLHLMGLVGLGLILLTTFIVIAYNSEDSGRLGTWKSRIESFNSGESEGNYQAEQSKIAIASGEIFGKRPGGSTQRNFLPHPYSDFIFAIIVEEYGLIGGFGMIVLYLILLYRGIRIAVHCNKTFGSLLSIGLCILLVFQAMINMGVAVNLLPVTGQPLPMVSMGGTSIWFTCIAIGIILSVSRDWESQKEQNVAIEGNN